MNIMNRLNMRMAGFAFCMLACVARAAGLVGGYTYKLVLRDDVGFVLSGVDTLDGDERASYNYKIEVYKADGEKIGATVSDAALGGDVGYNCTLAVPVGGEVEESAGGDHRGEAAELRHEPDGEGRRSGGYEEPRARAYAAPRGRQSRREGYGRFPQERGADLSG